MGADRMADVHLDEDLAEPGHGPRPPSAGARRARALLRRWWPAPVAVVLALGAAQAVADHRDEARADRLRATPGVLAETVTAPLDATPWGTSDAMGLVASGTRTPHGLVAGVLVPGTGDPAAVVALDAGTGDEVWRAEIGALPTEDGYTRSAACSSGTTGPADALWCAVTDGPAGDRGPETTRLVRVDLADGAVTVLRELEPRAEALVVGDVLVVATRQDGAVLLVGSGRDDGVERWRTELPDAVDEMYSSGWLTQQGGHVVVPCAADGYPLPLSPDDGSLPQVQPVLAQDGDGPVLRGVDPATGDVRWERRSEPSPLSGYLLLEGVLYGSDGATVWALDAASGEGLWSVPAAPAEGTWLMTDGRHLLRAERADGATDVGLSAYDLGSGRRAWTTPLPDDVQGLWPRDGVLYGTGGDGGDLFLLR